MRIIRINLPLIFAFAIMISCKVHAQFSRYVDFDGTGHGTLYTTSNISSPQGVCINCGSGPLGTSSGNNQQNYNNEIQALTQQRLNQQLLERQREKEKQDLIDQVNRLKKQQESLENLQELQRLQDALNKLSNQDARTRLKLKSRIIDSLSKFEQQQIVFLNRQSVMERRISQSILQIKVPVPAHPRFFKSALLLGMFQTPEIAKDAYDANDKNPFINTPYDTIFAFGSSETIKELKRNPSDHLLGDFNSLSSSSLKHLGELGGVKIENVVAHSNGAKVAEVLIRSGFISGVKTLRILGGDGALMNIERLQQLADEKGIKIYVYATKDDIVPIFPTGWKIMELAEQLSDPLKQDNNIRNLTYEVLGLKKEKASEQFKVQVELLYYHRRTSYYFEPHLYSTYYSIIKGRQLSGCLDETGDLKQKCKIY